MQFASFYQEVLGHLHLSAQASLSDSSRIRKREDVVSVGVVVAEKVASCQLHYDVIRQHHALW